MSYHFVHRSESDIGIWDKVTRYEDYYRCTSQKYDTLKEMVKGYDAVMKTPAPNFYKDDVFMDNSDDIYKEYRHSTVEYEDNNIGTLSDNQLLEILELAEL